MKKKAQRGVSFGRTHEKRKVNIGYMVNFEMLGITLTTGENQVYMTGYNLSNMASENECNSPILYNSCLKQKN